MKLIEPVARDMRDAFPRHSRLDDSVHDYVQLKDLCKCFIKCVNRARDSLMMPSRGLKEYMFRLIRLTANVLALIFGHQEHFEIGARRMHQTVGTLRLRLEELVVEESV